MKKILSLTAAAAIVLSIAGCGNKTESTTTAEQTTAAQTTAATENTTEAAKTEAATEGSKTEASIEAAAQDDAAGVMSYAEYAAADLDTPVVVETYVQAKQSWWDNKATLYTQAEDGAYFIYDMPCSEEDYAKLTAGTKIRVSGVKSEWSGEVEIIDAEFEIIDGNFIAAPEDVTAILGTDELAEKQNKFVSFKGMTVEAKKDADGNDAAFLYKWNGSGSEGDDLYFDVSLDGKTYTFTIRAYLCDSSTEVYKAVKALNIGDVIDMEGFLYWYEGPNPHITSVTAAA